MELREEAQLEKLTDNGLVIFQPKRGYRFSLDAILLARFPTVKPGFRVMDLGTGSGVIPLLLSTRAENLHITGVEIQPSLVSLAQKSVTLNNKEKNITIWEKDLRELEAEHNGKWDLVVSNPPYFKKSSGKVCSGESQAIARHELHCELEDIVKLSSKLLKPKGIFSLVHRSERLTELFGLLDKYGLKPIRLKLVHPYKSREATLFLLEALKGSGSDLVILPPLFIYEKQGCYSDTMEKIFSGLDV